MQTHLDEFSRRLTSVVILVVILSGVWSFSIDEILRYLLDRLDPCEDSCVNIFSPMNGRERDGLVQHYSDYFLQHHTQCRLMPLQNLAFFQVREEG